MACFTIKDEHRGVLAKIIAHGLSDAPMMDDDFDGTVEAICAELEEGRGDLELTITKVN